VTAAASDGWAPLHAEGHLEAARMLIVDYSASVTAADTNGNTFRHMACMNDYVKVARMLVDNGAEIKATNHAGETPLHHLTSPDDIKLLEEISRNVIAI